MAHTPEVRSISKLEQPIFALTRTFIAATWSHTESASSKRIKMLISRPTQFYGRRAGKEIEALDAIRRDVRIIGLVAFAPAPVTSPSGEV